MLSNGLTARAKAIEIGGQMAAGPVAGEMLALSALTIALPPGCEQENGL